MNPMIRRLLRAKWASFFLAILGITLLTVLLLPLRGHINATTIGFAFLLVVVFVAILWGSKPAFLASILGMLGFNLRIPVKNGQLFRSSRPRMRLKQRQGWLL